MLIVKPEWNIRIDPTNVLLYEQSPNGEINDAFVIHPFMAALLCMFDGIRTNEEVCSNVAYVLDWQLQDAEKLVEQLFRDYGGAFTECGSDHPSRLKPLPNPVEMLSSFDKIEFDPMGRLYAPHTVIWDITWACPRRCLYCYAETDQAPSQEVLPLERALSLVDEMADAGVLLVFLGGGDPFAYPGIESVVLRMLTRGITPQLATKSRLSENTVAAFTSAGLQYFQVSVDSAEPEIADFLTGSQGYLSDAENNLRLLTAYGLKINVNAVITPYNIQGVNELIDMLAHYNVVRIALSPYGRSHFRHRDDLFLSANNKAMLDQIVEAARTKYAHVIFKLGNIMDLASMPPEKRNAIWERRARCTAGRQSICILPDGRVIPCEQTPTHEDVILGDLKMQSLLDVWTSARAVEVICPQRDKFAEQPCYSCTEFEICRSTGSFCVRDAYTLFGTFYAPSPYCPKAEIKLRTM